jgi:GrpB-like predicted nucleotidyltransferase (UPF0157 family)
MPPPIKVELVPHDPSWADAAKREVARIMRVLGPNGLAVHHIGSTAIPGIHAKPILDLMPVVQNLYELDAARQGMESLGYQCWGEYGIPGRRYCTLDDSASGKRRVQLHCFSRGDPQIERHLSFRDALRADPALAREYDAEKRRCRELFPEDSHAYSDAKSCWIEATLARILNVTVKAKGKPPRNDSLGPCDSADSC